MIDLTPRQIQILRAIIEEFIQTADPVGSETLDKKFNIGVSPATIRNEMVYLSKQGYLNKDHSSSGRLPTPQAMKLYVNELMREKELSVADEVSAKEKIWNYRHKTHELLAELTKVLADRTKALSLAMLDKHDLYHSGYANLLEMPEFYDIKVMKQVLHMVEEVDELENMFQYQSSENQVQVVYGEELGTKNLQPVGFIHMTIDIEGKQCRIAVLGSNRFDYSYVIPMMKYVRTLLKEIVE